MWLEPIVYNPPTTPKREANNVFFLPIQPDGYLTEERKAQDPDQGFSTFFSETGMFIFLPVSFYMVSLRICHL